MKRYELSTKQWSLIKDHFPRNGHRGGQWKNHRKMVNGVLWVLHSGASWRDVPRRYGAWQTVYGRFSRWRKEGFWERLLRALQAKLDADGKIDWDEWFVDGSSVRASRAAAGGKKGGRRVRKANS